MFPKESDQLDFPTLIKLCRIGKYNNTVSADGQNENSQNDDNENSYTYKAMQCFKSINNSSQWSLHTSDTARISVNTSEMFGLSMLYEDIFRMIDHGKRFNQHNPSFQVIILLIF